MAEEKQKVYTEQEVRDVIKRMNNFGPREGEIAVCHWNPNLEKWVSDDKYQFIVREILTQDADLRNRVEGLVKAVRRAAAARKADREKLRRIVEVANAIDREMTPNDSFNQEKIRWASAIRNIAYGRTANV